jgi:protein arginine kinase activator
MICERCKKNTASFFYEENVNGEARSLSLCPECAAALQKSGDISGIFPFGGFSGIHDQLFGGLFGKTESPAKVTKSCELCGSTLADFRKNGKTGCPKCYEVFGDELKNTIRSIHGNVKHIGRSPAKFRKNREKEFELKSLKEELKQAIANENFEHAVTLRDKIKALENGEAQN